VNARAQADDLASRDPIIKPAIADRQIAVVAAVYDIESGEVSLI
jgi:carbonic anhydrase